MCPNNMQREIVTEPWLCHLLDVGHWRSCWFKGQSRNENVGWELIGWGRAYGEVHESRRGSVHRLQYCGERCLPHGNGVRSRTGTILVTFWVLWRERRVTWFRFHSSPLGWHRRRYDDLIWAVWHLEGMMQLTGYHPVYLPHLTFHPTQ